MIYLDFTATTPVSPEVAAEMAPFLTEHFGNSSSPHKIGVSAAAAVEKARDSLIQAVGLSDSHRCIFTSGGSEGNSQVFQALLGAEDRTGNVVVSAVEHKSVRSFLDRLRRVGYRVTEVAPEPDGTLPPDRIAAACDDRTRLVSIMGVNNETGFMFDLNGIAAAVRNAAPRARLHTDWVQGFLKLPVNLSVMDAVTVSSHKVFGPKGTGALFLRKTIPMPALIGGSHENGMRGGTHNTAGIVGFAAAVRRLAGKTERYLERVTEQRSRFKDRLAGKLPGMTVVESRNQSPYVLGILVPEIRSEVVVRMLSEKGVFISAGSACSTREAVANNTAAVLGFDPDHYLRISLHPVVTDEDLDAGADMIAETCLEFRQMMG